MPTVRAIAVGPINTNCYIVSDPTSHRALVIDPGSECDPVLAALDGLTVTDILLTHAHFDHIGGVQRLIAASNARLWIHALEADRLADPTRNLSAFFPDLCPPIHAPEASVLLTGGESVQIYDDQLHVIHTPGHSPGHVIYRLGPTVFTGDLLFREGVGRTDFPDGDAEALQESIRQSILALPDETRLLPGHGPATTVGHERRHNPFLRRAPN